MCRTTSPASLPHAGGSPPAVGAAGGGWIRSSCSETCSRTIISLPHEWQRKGPAGRTMIRTWTPQAGQRARRRVGKMTESTCPVSTGRTGCPQHKTAGKIPVRSAGWAGAAGVTNSARQRRQRNPTTLPMLLTPLHMRGRNTPS
jgi:hypothetical protein